MLQPLLVFLCVGSGILLLNNGIAETALTERFSWNPNRTVIVDRTIEVIDHHHPHQHPHHHQQQQHPGYFILGVDRTTFSVDRPLWLQQFDIVKVFGNDQTNAQRHVHRVPIKIKIRKIPEGDLKAADVIETVFTGHAMLNSTHETTVNVFSKVLLKPGFLYEVRLKMPERMPLMYRDNLDIREHKITRFFSKSILVNFYQHNPTVQRSQSGNNRDVDVKQTVSHGMVKRLHLKYSWF